MAHTESDSRKKLGVALILRNRYGEVLVLQERQTKPELGKAAGMYSIPMETVKSSEGESVPEALARLVQEEIPWFAGQVDFERSWRCAYRLAPRTWALLYLGFTWRIDEPAIQGPLEEVEGHTWVRPQEILGLWVRRGVREMIEDRYFSGRIRRICRTCVDPRMEMPKGPPTT